MTNYIGKIDAEWVDPRMETPMGVPTGSTNPPAWEGLADFGEAPINPGLQFCTYHDDHGWSVGIDGMPFPLRWLRIGGPSTDIPRAQVQAAVDEIAHERSISHKGLLLSEMGAPAEKFHEGRKSAFGCSVSLIKNHTGIMPREVQS